MSTLNLKLEVRHPHLILFKYNFEQLEKSDSQLTVEKVLLSFNSIIARFRLPLKCGRGGNHVWVSDIFDGRILIVESK